jgi:outer membrane protein assembly factor BamE
MKIMTETRSAPPAFRAAACLAALTMLAFSCGCVYRMPILQGNYLDPAAIAQVKPGMTRIQVRYLLGTPMLPGAFDDSRWDYSYYLKTRHLQTPRRGRVTVYFRDNVVARVDSDVKSPVPVAP